MSDDQRRLPTATERPLFVTEDEVAEADMGDGKDSALRPNSESNKRFSFRCPVQIENESALLFDQRRQHSVCLIDQSAGGFCVSYAGDTAFTEGQVLRLRTINGEYNVRVAYVEFDEDIVRIGMELLQGALRPSHGFASVIAFLIVALLSAALVYLVL